MAGWTSMSTFPERGEVTSDFLCGDRQVQQCHGGPETSSIDASVGKRLKLDPLSQGPCGRCCPPPLSSQSSHLASLVNLSSPQCSVSATFQRKREHKLDIVC